jgi:hypothetical protein
MAPALAAASGITSYLLSGRDQIGEPEDNERHPEKGEIV